jgi:hypothetical protein
VAAKQITRKMEEDEYQLWLKKTSSAGIRRRAQFLGGLERAGVAGLAKSHHDSRVSGRLISSFIARVLTRSVLRSNIK